MSQALAMMLRDREITKTCQTCGTVHTAIPVSARKSDMGTFWECDCKSTMFVPSEEAVAQLAEWKRKKEAA